MKKNTLLTMLLCCTLVGIAQTNNYWKLGYHTGVDFKTGNCNVNSTDTCNMQMFNTNTSICDNTGRIIFYSNSLFVKNKLDVNMPNGANFNHGTISDNYISIGATPTFNGATIIPFPNDTNKFYMFYTNMEYNIKGAFLPDRLRYLVVDKSLNGGLGDVILKDVNVITDTLMDGQIHAVKYGNGTDYWLIARKYSSNIFYKVLINSNGVSVVDTQAIGNAYILGANAAIFCVQSNESKQGDKLVYLYEAGMLSGTPLDGQMDLIDFDRCTGNITASRSYALPASGIDTSLIYLEFVSFAPNDSLLYLNNGLYMCQFNLYNSNLMNSKVDLGKLTSWDFGQMQIGPDNKIYCAGRGGSQTMHVINNPNVLGVGCNFIQNQINFGGSPHYSNGGLPNVPNFSLGAVSPLCVVGVNEIKNEEFLFKNLYGIGEMLQLPTNIENEIKIYDVMGRQMYSSSQTHSSYQFNQSGVFIYQLKNKTTKQLQTGKIVVQ